VFVVIVVHAKEGRKREGRGDEDLNGYLGPGKKQTCCTDSFFLLFFSSNITIYLLASSPLALLSMRATERATKRAPSSDKASGRVATE